MKKIRISNHPDWSEIDPLFITLIDRIAEEPRPSPNLVSRENLSHYQAYVVNHLTGLKGSVICRLTARATRLGSTVALTFGQGVKSACDGRCLQIQAEQSNGGNQGQTHRVGLHGSTVT
jgi:hypothetical protein